MWMMHRLRIAAQLLLCQLVCEISAQQCEGEYSIFGMMLKKHIFKTIKTSNSPECIQACSNDVRCQSFNYVISQYMCELNNRTKEARPEDYVPDSGRYYYGRVRKRVPLGSIPELPAETCKEIKASEGGQVVSGKYWFDFIIPGKVVLAHCNMETEGITDIDECVSGIDDCLKDLATCTNTLGSFTCACIHGYDGDGKTSCVPLPKECLIYTNLTEGKRKVTAITEVPLCDSRLVPGWYRFHGDAGTKMPTTCPPTKRCGTDAPGWLNGAHPTMAEGLVTRQGPPKNLNHVDDASPSHRGPATLMPVDITDIDECDIGIHDCLSDLATCTNTLGSYTCACNSGYVGDGKTSCVPLPEECLTYTNLTDSKRKVTAIKEVVLCDSELVPGWYRFQGDAGTKMPTTCPPKYSCNTHAPGWLNGAHPTVAEGQVTRQVCFHWSSSCCYNGGQWPTSIQVRNCGSYYVYYLIGTGCNLRYCSTD
ncbi:hypothetical protein ACROYT_G030182 [Oculina patagonica]